MTGPTTNGTATSPTVAVVIAARNEAARIPALLDSLVRQTYPSDRVEIVVADGGSTDGTPDAVEEWARGRAVRTRVIDNPGRVTASGLNEGIAATESDIVIVLGAHASVPSDFVERSIEVLTSSGAACAGGVLETDGGPTPTGRAIAAATTSPFGVGNALFRTGAATSRDVDTVAFGAYRRDVLERVGGFDVALVGAEDDELNFRIVLSGATIRFDPRISSRYFCRTSFRALSRQYFLYGRGKAWVMRKHRRPPSARSLAPAALVAGVLGAAGLGAALRRPWLVLVPVVPYAAGVAVGASRAPRDVSRLRMAAALVTLHLSYGVGLFAGFVTGSVDAPTRSN